MLQVSSRVFSAHTTKPGESPPISSSISPLFDLSLDRQVETEGYFMCYGLQQWNVI